MLSARAAAAMNASPRARAPRRSVTRQPVENRRARQEVERLGRGAREELLSQVVRDEPVVPSQPLDRLQGALVPLERQGRQIEPAGHPSVQSKRTSTAASSKPGVALPRRSARLRPSHREIASADLDHAALRSQPPSGTAGCSRDAIATSIPPACARRSWRAAPAPRGPACGADRRARARTGCGLRRARRRASAPPRSEVRPRRINGAKTRSPSGSSLSSAAAIAPISIVGRRGGDRG